MDESIVLNATESVWNLLTSETVVFLMIVQIGLHWVEQWTWREFIMRLDRVMQPHGCCSVYW